MRALYCGLLLVLINAHLRCVDSHEHNDTDHKVSTEPPTEAAPVCLTTNRTNEDLQKQLTNLDNCHKDKGNDLRPLIDDLKADYDNTSKRLKAYRTCFEDYVSNVSDCYQDTMSMWNTTIHMLAEVEDYLCEGSIVCAKLQAFYRGAASYCSNTTDARSCGDNIMTTLLFQTSYKEVVKKLLSLDYSMEHCKDETRISSCVVDKLKTCRQDEPLADIAEGLQKRIMAATCGVSCLLHSSMTVWLFLAALYSAQRLLS